MQRVILFLSIAMSFLLAPSASALSLLEPACQSGNSAANSSPACQQSRSQLAAKSNPVVRIIHDAVNILSLLSGIIAVIIIVYSGIRFILSGNNPEGQKTARSSLTGALIGLVIIAIAWTVVNLIINLLS